MDAKTPSIGSQIDKLWALREKKRELGEQVKKVEKEFDELEEAIKQRLIAEGSQGSKTTKASVSLTEEIVGNITDFDALWEFARKKNYPQLFQRRLSNPAFRELAALYIKKGGVPGVEPFKKINLNLSTLKEKL